MALMDLKSDLSWYGANAPGPYKTNNDVSDTKFKLDANGVPFVESSGYESQGNAILAPINRNARDSFLIDDVSYSSRGFASRAAQLGIGTKFPIGPEGQLHQFDKIRTGFNENNKYDTVYGVKYGRSGLADTYTVNSPIDDQYNKFNLRDDATPNSYIKHPLILRGIQREGSSDPQRWGLVGTQGGAFDIPRGGLLTSATRTAIDEARIGKFLTSPKGIGFIAKQVGYQLMNPKKETRVWNPASIPGSLVPGMHVRRDATAGGLLGGLVNAIIDQPSSLEILLNENRDTKLLKLGKKSIGSTWAGESAGVGGPGSLLGVGGTIFHKWYDTNFDAQRITGLSLDTNVDKYHVYNYSDSYQTTRGESGKRFIKDIDNGQFIMNPNPLNIRIQDKQWPEIHDDRGGRGAPLPGGGIAVAKDAEIKHDYTLLAYNDIPKRGPGTTKIITIIKGQKKTYSDEARSNFGKNIKLMDEINEDRELSLIDFEFESLVECTTKYVKFKAYLGSISDNFAPGWNGETDQGRADARYQYQSFERTITFDFQVVVERGKDGSSGFQAIWTKLQTLAKMTHPVYGTEGFYGQTVDVTIGKLFVARPMIITDLGYDWDNETPWEIDEDYQAPMYTNVQMSCTILGDPERNRPEDFSKIYNVRGL